MPNLAIYTKNNDFYIESFEIALNNLRIENQKGSLLFEKEEANCWKISVDDVAALLECDQESRAFIYYGEEKTQLSADNFQIKAKNSLVLNYFEQPIYLYFGMDNKLRFIWHQVPSARGYHLSNKAVFLTEHTPQLTIQVETKHVPLINIELIMRNRETNEIVLFPIPIRQISQNENNIFLNNFLFTFNESVLENPFFQKLSLHHYEVTTIDFFIQIQSEYLPLTDYRFRLASPIKEPVEITSFYKNERTFISHFYTTPFGNLSARYHMVPYEMSHTYFNSKPTEQTNKPIVLLFEYPHKAQDNALAFFNYLMTHDQTFDVYYVIEKNSPDLKNLAAYPERVIEYRSPKHVELFFKASYLISSHTPSYGMPLFTNRTVEKRNQAHTIFLQHGITALKNVEFYCGKQSNPDLIDTFIVSSQREKELVHNELFYPESAIKITGMARFDRLLKQTSFWHAYQKRKRLLIMPSWRKGQEHLSEKEFIETDFYEGFISLLTNERLQAAIHQSDLTISLYLHNNFQKYRHLFQTPGIRILESEAENVQDLMKSHGIMVTDFSSVGLDFVLQKRPVFYYQFEEEIAEKRADPNQLAFLPGPVYSDPDKLVSAILKKTRWNILSREYRQNLKKNLYTYMDSRACERTYQVLCEIESDR